jgi:hypothetical protein
LLDLFSDGEYFVDDFVLIGILINDHEEEENIMPRFCDSRDRFR